ncbi:MAG: O-antigen ligase family protein [Sphingomicrobium sp.]
MQRPIPIYGKGAAPGRPLASDAAVAGGIAPGDLIRSRMPILPLVGLLTLSAVFGGVSRLLNTEATWPLLLVYAAWGIAAAILVAKGFRLPATEQDRWSPATVGLLLFLGSVWLSTILLGLFGDRYDYGDVVRQTAMVTYTALPFFAAVYAARRMDFERAVLFTCHVLLALCLSSVLLDFSGLTEFESFGSRYFGFLGDGVAWLVTLPMIVYFTTSRFILSGAGALVLLLTLSRGATLVVAGAILLLLAFGGGRSRLHYGPPLIATIGVLAYNHEQFLEFINRFSRMEIEQSGRVVTSLNGLSIFRDSPVIGYGYNSLGYYFPVLDVTSGEFAVASSPAIQMLSDGGMIAFTGFIIFVITMSYLGVRSLTYRSDASLHQVVVGLTAWLLATIWLNHSASWFLVTSPLAPLVFGVSGLVAGYAARQALSRHATRSPLTSTGSVRLRPTTR